MHNARPHEEGFEHDYQGSGFGHRCRARAFSGTADPRVRELLVALVRHLHGFLREVRLTEAEFQEAARLIAAMGQRTTDSHNEVVLMAGSLGVSALVCLLNNGAGGQTETQANMLGPFWREDQPLCESGATLVRSATPGPQLAVDVRVEDSHGRPVEGAMVDVWHSSPEGLYGESRPCPSRDEFARPLLHRC